MRQRLRWIIVLILLAAGMSACGSAANQEFEGAQDELSPEPEPPPPEASPTVKIQPTLPTLPVVGPAPDFDNEVWINSEPMNLADLEGKVVLVEFWTFG